MKFMCPKCGTKEEVVGDGTPLCPFCRTTLIEIAPGYADLLMSPNEAIRTFEIVIAKHGLPQAWSSRFKHQREAWITAVWALGLREITGCEYWIEVEMKDPPDCKVRYVDSSAGYNQRGTINVEIVEWDHHRPNVMDVIIRKCANKYPGDFRLLVFARNGKPVGTQAAQQVKSLAVPFKEIWVLGRASVEEDKYRMFTLHPRPLGVDFALSDVLQKNSSQAEFARFDTKRSKRTKPSYRGSIHLPIP
jgi:hypothetical protein